MTKKEYIQEKFLVRYSNFEENYTGETFQGMTEIKSGLKAGDFVITAGYLDLENGQSINY